MAYALLGTSYQNLGERGRGAEMITKAYELPSESANAKNSTSIPITSILLSVI